MQVPSLLHGFGCRIPQSFQRGAIAGRTDHRATRRKSGVNEMDYEKIVDDPVDGAIEIARNDPEFSKADFESFSMLM
jgi:hypothetical protein